MCKFVSALFCISAAFMVSGCAGFNVSRVTNYDQPGVRYWRPATFLLVKEVVKDNVVVCDVSVVNLPDKTEEYAMTWTPGMGTVTAKPTLSDGWNLTALETTADSKTPENLNAIANLLGKVAPGGLIPSPDAKAAAKSEERCPRGAVGVYRVEYSRGRIHKFEKVPGLL